MEIFLSTKMNRLIWPQGFVRQNFNTLVSLVAYLISPFLTIYHFPWPTKSIFIVLLLKMSKQKNRDSGMVCISDDAPLIQTVQSTSYSYSIGRQVALKTSLLKLQLKSTASMERNVQTRYLNNGPVMGEISTKSGPDTDSERAQKHPRISPFVH